MFVLHPSGQAAREFVAGRIVDFDHTGAAEVTHPAVVAHYTANSYETYSTLEEWGRLDVSDDHDAPPPYNTPCPHCDAPAGEPCTTNGEPREQPHKRRIDASHTDDDPA